MSLSNLPDCVSIGQKHAQPDPLSYSSQLPSLSPLSYGDVVAEQSSVGKSSLQISLVLVGVAGLTACSNNDGTRYDYNNREECVKDWGETECPPQSSGSGGGRVGYSYYRYGSYSYDAQRGAHAKSITRGGFGSHAGGSRGG